MCVVEGLSEGGCRTDTSVGLAGGRRTFGLYLSTFRNQSKLRVDYYE